MAQKMSMQAPTVSDFDQQRNELEYSTTGFGIRKRVRGAMLKISSSKEPKITVHWRKPKVETKYSYNRGRLGPLEPPQGQHQPSLQASGQNFPYPSFAPGSTLRPAAPGSRHLPPLGFQAHPHYRLTPPAPEALCAGRSPSPSDSAFGASTRPVRRARGSESRPIHPGLGNTSLASQVWVPSSGSRSQRCFQLLCLQCLPEQAWRQHKGSSAQIARFPPPTPPRSCRPGKRAPAPGGNAGP